MINDYFQNTQLRPLPAPDPKISARNRAAHDAAKAEALAEGRFVFVGQSYGGLLHCPVGASLTIGWYSAETRAAFEELMVACNAKQVVLDIDGNEVPA